MQMIVKAELVFDDGSVEQATLASFERHVSDLSLRNLGLTLDDGKLLLRRVQQCLSESQAAAWLKQRAICPCGWTYPHKDSRVEERNKCDFERIICDQGGCLTGPAVR